jgi:peptidoglycan/xylan/chitin deacetylase (PgdA/CDA1 family)
VGSGLAAAWPLLLRHSAGQARRQGFDRLRAVVSFDCDTDRDIAVVPAVHARMREAGVLPAYAVPGELLERGAAVYADVAADGAEVLNHGYAEHCTLDEATRTYTSTGFYDEMSDAEVADDVRRGHEAVADLIGRAPRGFRAPHFGTFQRADRLRRLHALLASLGYRYSSSTMPVIGLLRGPVVAGGSGILELPVSGRPTAPHRVLDSWSFRFAPGRTVDEADWEADVRRLVDGHLAGRRPGLVNLYADPSQVDDWPGFFRTMAVLAPHAAPSFCALLDDIDR